jgi:2-dehydro-3-deoxyglucarate aldolase
MRNRLSKILSLREKIRAGTPTIGSWMQLPSTSVAEIMGDAGYDWVTIDLEHGSMSTSQLPDLFRALELGGTLPLVRLAHGHLKDAKDALDAGAGGIIIPMVESPDQLHSIIQHSCWPPEGIRGVGFSRANLYGKYFEDYRLEARNPLIIAQIEHIKAVNNIDAILQVSGLDAIIIGPYDLSASMNLTAQFSHPDFISALEIILEACKRLKKAAGVHIVNPDPAELDKRINEGYQFIAYSIDSVFMNRAATNPVNKSLS